LSCHIDSSFRQNFIGFLKPVIDEGANYVKGQNDEEKKAIISKWLDELIEGNQWRRLFYWIAALKLVQDQNLRRILENNQYGRRANKPGFDWATAIFILIDPNSEWDKPIKRLRPVNGVKS